MAAYLIADVVYVQYPNSLIMDVLRPLFFPDVFKYERIAALT